MANEPYDTATAERLRGLGHKVRGVLDEVVERIGVDGHDFTADELVILHALELVRLKLFGVTVPRAFLSAEDQALREQMAATLRDVRDFEYARLRGRQDFLRYIGERA